MKHAISVHLESFAFSSNPAIANLSSEEKKRLDNGSIVTQVDRLIDLFKAHNQQATIFVVSIIDTWYPDLLDKLKAAGHEVAWHGHTHGRLHTSESFRRELDLAAGFIDKFKPLGYCSPEFCFWEEGYHLLREAGFKYSNSCLSDSAPVEIDGILEIPVSAYRWGGGNSPKQCRGISLGMLAREVPFGSSFIIALIRGAATVWFIKKREKKTNAPSNLFFHNWQAFDEGEAARRDRMWYFRKNPLYFPYLLNIERPLRHILARVQFTTLQAAYLHR
ncbi:MAG: hypothetical protein C0404_00515 [Verrucomicrobia bacterium]|nr:hypothetical protein [Verrucomicrobiota bacterium]